MLVFQEKITKIDIVLTIFSQIILAISPLIILPHLSQILGLENLGKILSVQYFFQLTGIIVSYGFQWSSLREMAHCKNEKQILSIYITTVCTQCILLVPSLIITIIYCFLIQDGQEKTLIAIFFLSQAGSIINTTWFLRGVGRIGIMVLIQTITNLLVLISIFFIIDKPSEVILSAILLAASPILSGLAFITWLISTKTQAFIAPNKSEIKEKIKKNKELFISQITITSYTTLIPIIISHLGTNEQVALFAISEKIQKLFRFSISPIMQIIYPKMCSLWINNTKLAIKRLALTLSAILLYSLISLLIFYFFSEKIAIFFIGNNVLYLPSIIEITAVISVFILINVVIGEQFLIATKKEARLNKILIKFSFFTPLISIANMYYFSDLINQMIIILITEFIILALMLNEFIKFKHQD
jgi:PST family polysaccharide transporter